jgi:prepilin-type N-terminal cleavage/methylation domain-containing protein
MRRGYTLIELMISISIMALLTVLLVPVIDKSLSKNNIASDAELIASQVESTRLLAGSTQQFDNGQGFYGLFIPSSGSQFYIVRISGDGTGKFALKATDQLAACPIDEVFPDPTALPNCIVSTESLSSNVTFAQTGASTDPQTIIFNAPTQTLVNYSNPSATPAPSSGWTVKLTLNGSTKIATLSIDGVTGSVTTSYTN